MEAHPSATYKGYDIYPLVYKHTAERAWGNAGQADPLRLQ